MTNADATSFFGNYISGDSIKLPNGCQIYVDNFVDRFGDCPAIPTAQDLRNVDAGIMGFEPFIQQCEQDGLFS